MREWNYENDQWTKLPIHLRHLPLFTRHLDWASIFIRWIWANFLKFIFFKFYVRLKVVGNFAEVYRKHPKLIVISNHASHLDAISIAAAIPFTFWLNLYFAAAKDYFFSNYWMTFFSKHCIGAIPIDRKDRKGEAVKLCIDLLTRLNSIWLVMFPEGTRSQTGKISMFKKGVSTFSQRTNTSILFLFLDGAYERWPKNASFASPGKLTVYVGPVHPPAAIEEIYVAYKKWVNTICPNQFLDDDNESRENKNQPIVEDIFQEGLTDSDRALAEEALKLSADSSKSKDSKS